MTSRPVRPIELAALLILPILGACHQMKPLGADEIRVSGTVELTEVGIDCWRLAARDGQNYEIRKGQAPADLLVHGKVATLILKLRPDLMSSCQVGQIADVVKVEY